jgi:hypothetical protein
MKLVKLESSFTLILFYCKRIYIIITQIIQDLN